MSRIRAAEVSSPISLFPFIGILLCTMGALLVILVAVSRSAGDSAKQEIGARKRAAVATTSDADRQKLQDITRYVASLDSVKSVAAGRLREGQARLSHIEDHIRRLQDKLRSLQAAAGELESLEEQHFGDREQAEREVKRLEELAAEARSTIDELQQQADTETHSYALVPYEGPNGTHRRPIYVECANDKIILQPEGVEISSDDLVQPIGAGNPLASALRAARDHLVRLHPGEGQTRDTEPYPLLLVRANGLLMFNRARVAIEAGDFDLGFELVENDWELKYPSPDPSLAAIEQQAIEQAVARQEVLAAAAPRAYSHPGLAAAGEFEFEDEGGGMGDGGGGYGTGGGGSRTYLVRGKSSADNDGEDQYGSGDGSGEGGEGNSSGGGFGAGGSGPPGAVAAAVSPGGSGGSPAVGDQAAGEYSGAGNAGSGGGASGRTGNAGGSGQLGGGGGNGGPGGAPGGGGAGGGNVAGGASGSGYGGGQPGSAAGVPQDASGVGLPGDSAQQPNSFSAMTGSPPTEAMPGHYDENTARAKGGHAPSDLSKTRGKDWALGKLSQRAIPVRRTIHIVVRQDQIAIMPDEDPTNGAAPAGDVVLLKGDTVEALDQFVGQVHERIESWGIAGNGLYWRPVLLLSIGPDGQRRADDLTRLLKNSGLDFRTNDTAKNTGEGQTHETR